MQLERTPSEIVRTAPRRGEHSMEILQEIGYAESELRDMKTAGVI